MATKAELHKMIDRLTEEQLHDAKAALARVLQGHSAVPVCDLGTAEDIVSLYKTVAYDNDDENKH